MAIGKRGGLKGEGWRRGGGNFQNWCIMVRVGALFRGGGGTKTCEALLGENGFLGGGAHKPIGAC